MEARCAHDKARNQLVAILCRPIIARAVRALRHRRMKTAINAPMRPRSPAQVRCIDCLDVHGKVNGRNLATPNVSARSSVRNSPLRSASLQRVAVAKLVRFSHFLSVPAAVYRASCVLASYTHNCDVSRLVGQIHRHRGRIPVATIQLRLQKTGCVACWVHHRESYFIIILNGFRETNTGLNYVM